MKRLACVLAFVLLLMVAAGAQTFRGAINGSVTDPSGSVVPNAQVKATDTGTGLEHSTVTTSDGQFVFQDLPLGNYKVAVTAQGFASTTIDNVPVTAGNVYSLPIKLSLGKESTTVEVSAAAIMLDTSTPTQTYTIAGSSVQNIPLNGRDWSQLIGGSAGYGGYAVNGFGSLNGTRPNQVNWQIDGTDNNDLWHNIPAVNQGGVSGIAGVIMPIDAIEDFSSQTQSNAEAGRNPGGTVNVVIKSGTNAIHGSAYYYNRNNYYAARSPFFQATPEFPKAPPLTNQNVGGVLGAPIIKDKLFFFTGFEYQVYKFGLTGLSTEPSDAWVAAATAKLTAFGVPVNPLSQTLLNTLWPSSIRNLPATLTNYFATVPGTGYSYNGVAKLDYNITPNNTLSIHGFWGQGSQSQPPGASLALATASSNLGYYFEVAPIHVQNYSAVLNSVITPHVSNQFLFGLSYFNQVFHDANNSFDSHALGLFTSPDALKQGKPIFGAPNIAISGFDQVGITPPEGRNDITDHYTDIISWTKGKHQFRFGGEYRRSRVDEFYFRRSLGFFSFDGSQGPWAGTCAGSDPTCALADYLAGDVSSSSIAVGNAERKVVATGIDFFVQDSWRLTPRFTVDWGLRWEYFGPLHSNGGVNDLAVFIPNQGFKIQGNGIDSIFPAYHKNFAPRVGFAWQPTSSPDLVLRGGIGVFYDQINMNPFLDFRPGGHGADGLQDNPVGPHPVDNYNTDVNGQVSYTWQPNTYIFSGVTTCPTLNGCGNNVYNVYSVAQNFRPPYFYNYNLQLEKGLGNQAAIQIGYVGSVAHRLNVMLNINQDPVTLADVGPNSPFRALANLGTVLQENSIGNSNYNAIQTTFKMHTWHGFTGQVNYTWAHALDEMTEYRGSIPFDSYNLRLDYGNSDFDTRHLLSGFWTYDIPGSKHGPAVLTHGWQVGGALNFHTGQPFNWEGGTQRSGAYVFGNPFTVPHVFNAANGGLPWVNPLAFCFAGDPNTPCMNLTDPVGNLRRNQLYGPGFGDIDLNVGKSIPITERVRVQLRADIFNLFNRKNLATGPGSVGSNGYVSDTIGDYNGAPGLGPGEPFNMQISGKIVF